MQNKGLIRGFAILFGLVCIYQLSFTFIAGEVEDNAVKYAEQKISTDVPNYADLRHQAVSQYLDSVANEPVFAGITYKDARGKQLNKGLDLKGGISVILQISVKGLLQELSNHSTNPAFLKALKQADQKMRTSQAPYLELFFQSFEKIPDAKLASPDIFANKEMSGAITFDMSNKQVEKVLRKRIDESIVSAFKVLRKRVNQFGVAQPSIQRLGNTGRILIELPGAQDIVRAKNLLQSTAQLEFWHVYQAQDFSQFFKRADAKLADLKTQNEEPQPNQSIETDSTQTVADTTAEKENNLEALLSSDEEETDAAISDTDHPLLNLVRGFGAPQGPVIAQFALKDTAKVNDILHNPAIRSLLPADMKYARFAWGIPDEKTNIIGLYALKSNKENIAPLTGSIVTAASQTYDQMSRPAVSLEMNPKGAKIWEQMTGIAYKQNSQIAIVLDNVVYSAPGVTTGAIAGGRSQITGNFTVNEAKDLATVLEAGKLPAEANIAQIQVVGPSLGQEAINNGIMSFAIALGVVLIFMYFYYGKAGLFADFAMLVNLLFIFGILAGLGAVLTLPGIAGMILTIAISVDANVLIFERSKEELRLGKSQPAAIEAGFKQALAAILDAHITTAVAGIILLIFGTGGVKGFAVTLLIGVATSLFTAIYIAHLFVDNYRTNNKPLHFSTPPTKNLLSNIKFDFIGKRKLVYTISIIACTISIIAFFTRGLNQGVDFVGGRSYTVRFDHKISPEKVEKELTATFGSAEVKTYGPSNQLKITTKYKVNEQGEEVENQIKQMLFQSLQTDLPQGMTYQKFKSGDTQKNYGIMSSIKVGPTIADNIKTAALWSVIAAFAGIFLYILLRFRKWQFSLGAVISLIHDSIIIIGVFSLLHGIMPFSMEVGQDFIAALLTIIGYSINDTVVVYDRIREYFKVHPSWGLSRNINESICTTLGRTVITSMITLLVLLSIFFFGGASLRSFMFALIIGVVVGTYSSVFVASPIMYEGVRREGEDVLEKAAAKRKKEAKLKSAIK